VSVNPTDFAATYRLEAEELLSELEETLLELEESPDDMELVARTFRALHTIKGSGAMNGFDTIAEFTHDIETMFDKVREGELSIDREIVDLGLRAKDHIRGLLNDETDEGAGSPILVRVKQIMGGDASGGPVHDVSAAPQEKEPVTYRVRFRPERGIFENGTNIVPLLRELRGLGDCLVFGYDDEIHTFDDFHPEQCYVWWDVLLTTDKGTDAIHDVFMFVDDRAEIDIAVVDKSDDGDIDERKLGHILVERGDITDAQMDEAVAAQKRFGEILTESGVVSDTTIESALAEQQIVREKRRQRSEENQSIRVPVDKLTLLVNLVGELVTAQARLNQIASGSHEPALLGITEEMERLVADLRDNALSIRMLPIGTTFSRFRRVVRDLSAELGKEIELQTTGAEVELDKTMIERLADPLVHLIRNSVDHGVETPEAREASGKPRQGVIHLSAEHSEAHVVVTIRDDGAGMDPEKIRAKAVKNGLISADDPIQPPEIYKLIFEAGFSTAQSLTSVSGRGVGMDVVKRSVEALRGSVSVDSELGKGTTVTLKLPLTLAIIEGLLVRVEDERYVIPLSLVDECSDLTQEDVQRAHGREVVEMRGHLVPYTSLRKFFHDDRPAPDVQQLVITHSDGQGFGLVVDEVEGQIQAVIKNLGRMYEHIEGFSGATILGDGTVALILDVQALSRSAQREELMAVGRTS
jgi:two-component system chemotaxis sensor kinase CheA